MPRSARRYGSSTRNGEASPDLAASSAELGVVVTSRSDIDNARPSSSRLLRWNS